VSGAHPLAVCVGWRRAAGNRSPGGEREAHQQREHGLVHQVRQALAQPRHGQRHGQVVLSTQQLHLNAGKRERGVSESERELMTSFRADGKLPVVTGQTAASTGSSQPLEVS
jgi:hypothetical protein